MKSQPTEWEEIFSNISNKKLKKKKKKKKEVNSQIYKEFIQHNTKTNKQTKKTPLNNLIKNGQRRTSLVVQWLRIHFAMQGTPVVPWFRKIPHATRQQSFNYWRLQALESMLHNKPLKWEAYAPQLESSPCTP